MLQEVEYSERAESLEQRRSVVNFSTNANIHKLIACFLVAVVSCDSALHIASIQPLYTRDDLKSHYLLVWVTIFILLNCHSSLKVATCYISKA